MSNGKPTTDRRLGELELGQAKLQENLAGLTEDLKTLTSAVHSLAGEIRTRERERTPTWWVILGTAGSSVLVLIAIITMIGAPWAARLSGAEADVKMLTLLPGRVSAQEMKQSSDYARNRDDIADLDTRIQREMRDLDETLRSETRSLYWRNRSERMEERLAERGIHMPDAHMDKVGNGDGAQ